jgi:hypothetical protein
MEFCELSIAVGNPAASQLAEFAKPFSAAAEKPQTIWEKAFQDRIPAS